MLLRSIRELLEHVKDVNKYTIELSSESALAMGHLITKNSLEIDDETATALQYQDIISQQLEATTEAIEQIQNSFMNFDDNEFTLSDKMKVLDAEFLEILQVAKDKKSAFSGRVHSNENEEIEFF